MVVAQTPSRAAPAPTGILRLSLLPHVLNGSKGGSVLVTVEITNVSANRIEFLAGSPASYDVTIIDVATGDGVFPNPQHLSERTMLGGEVHSLAAGASFRFALQLGQLYRFQHPGTYQVAVSQTLYLMPAGYPVALSSSNSVVVVVRSALDALKKKIEECAVAGAHVDANIDSDIQGAQRAAVKKLMLSLPPSARCGTVASTDADGRLISNREGDLVSVNISAPSHPIGNGLWKNRLGEVFVPHTGDVGPSGPEPTAEPLSTPGAFVGAWKCGTGATQSLYVLTAFGTGNRTPFGSHAPVDRFTYSVSDDFLIERSESGVTTRHRFRVQGDILNESVPTELDCKRLS